MPFGIYNVTIWSLQIFIIKTFTSFHIFSVWYISGEKVTKTMIITSLSYLYQAAILILLEKMPPSHNKWLLFLSENWTLKGRHYHLVCIKESCFFFACCPNLLRRLLIFLHVPKDVLLVLLNVILGNSKALILITYVHYSFPTLSTRSEKRFSVLPSQVFHRTQSLIKKNCQKDTP